MPVGSATEPDTIIVGGGVIGLSLAWELGKRGQSVTVLDRGSSLTTTSWAGAGILPPAPGEGAAHPSDELSRHARALHTTWARELLETTGIDNGYVECGGLYFARGVGEMASLLGTIELWKEEGLEASPIAKPDLAKRLPHLVRTPVWDQIQATYELTGEAQIRNPRHLQALEAACHAVGVSILRDREVNSIRSDHGQWRINYCHAGDEKETACANLCVTGGAWSASLLRPLGIEVGIVPIRGQMLLYKLDEPLFTSILNEGPQYLVPRTDGRVLVGSTEEEAGFDVTTTPESLARLKRFASDWCPALDDDRLEKSWAGLRPGSFDGFPYLGEIPSHPGLFLAAGHFRSGLYWSPATAVDGEGTVPPQACKQAED